MDSDGEGVRSGMIPESLLLLSRSTVRSLSVTRLLGIFPARELDERSKISSDLN
uniref:Uncharacterized protein n=1 Tax=Arundo donax TaxID=35708 RepID=A0A0A9CYS9_ARUDO